MSAEPVRPCIHWPLCLAHWPASSLVPPAPLCSRHGPASTSAATSLHSTFHVITHVLSFCREGPSFLSSPRNSPDPSESVSLSETHACLPGPAELPMTSFCSTGFMPNRWLWIQPLSFLQGVSSLKVVMYQGCPGTQGTWQVGRRLCPSTALYLFVLRLQAWVVHVVLKNYLSICEGLPNFSLRLCLKASIRNPNETKWTKSASAIWSHNNLSGIKVITLIPIRTWWR